VKVGFGQTLNGPFFTYFECAIFGCLEAVYLAKIDGGTTVPLIELSPGVRKLDWDLAAKTSTQTGAYLMTPAPSTAVKVSRSHRSTRGRDFHHRARFLLKTKTKAKKRYLKAKKDRKKHRRAAAARSTPAADGTVGRDDAGGDIDSDDGHTSDSDEESETVVVDVGGKGVQAEHENASIQHQPRKKKHRRKEKSEAVIPTEDGNGDVVVRPRLVPVRRKSLSLFRKA